MPDDRDKRRPLSPPAGVAEQLAAPHEVDDEITGTHAAMSAEQIKAVADDNMYQRVKSLSEGYKTLATKQAGVDGQVAALVRVTENQNKLLGDLVSASFNAGLRVRTKRAETDIDDTADARKSYRKLVLGLVSALGGGLVTLLIAAITKGC